MRVTYCVLVLFVSLCLFDCKKKDKDNPQPTPALTPVVNPAYDIDLWTDTSASCNGTVLVSGGTLAITAVGMCWDTVPEPTILKWHTTDILIYSSENFRSQIYGLKPGTTYYLRAYATSSLGTVYSSQGQVTTDKNHWRVVASNLLNNPGLNCMASSGAFVFAGTLNGVIFSPDTGNTWTSFGLSGMPVSSIALHHHVVYALLKNGSFYSSPDNAQSWTLLNSRLPSAVGQILSLAANDDKVLVGTEMSVYSSTDNGNTWVADQQGLPAPLNHLNQLAGRVDNLAANGQSAYITFFSLDTARGKFVTTIYQKNGTTWQNRYEIDASPGGPVLNVGSYAMAGSNLFLYYFYANATGGSPQSQYGDLEITSNGGTILFNTSFGAIYRFCAQGNSALFITNSGAASLSPDAGNNWEVIPRIGFNLLGVNNDIKPYMTDYHIWLMLNGVLYKYRIS